MATRQEKMAELVELAAERDKDRLLDALGRIADYVEKAAELADRVEFFGEKMLRFLCSDVSQCVVIGREPNGEWYAGIVKDAKFGRAWSIESEVHAPIAHLDIAALLGDLHSQWWKDREARGEVSPF